MISEVIVNTHFNRLIKNWLVVNTFEGKSKEETENGSNKGKTVSSLQH